MEVRDLEEKLFNKPLVIVCCGGVGTAVSIWAFKNGIKIVGACDDSPDKIGKHLMGVEITDINPIVNKWGNKANYVTATMDNGIQREKYLKLHGLGIDNLNIYARQFLERFELEEKRLDCNKIWKHRSFRVVEHEDEYEKVTSLLSDNESVEVYSKMISRHINNSNYMIKENYVSDLGYYGHEFFSFSNDEILIDCGVLDGDTIKEFIDICPNYKRIYGIEADRINLLKSKWVTEYRDTSLLLCAISDKNEMISFNAQGLGTSRISDAGDDRVVGIRGDDLRIAPTIIKMDIEGAELSALKGFSNTIKCYKPKLAICLYHRVEDYWTIPIYIHNLVPQYKLYVRNGSDCNNNNETVLYATL